jgi:AraC family transcriptional regulator
MPHEAVAIAALARDAGVHPVHLARAFRRHCGCTPGEFQVALRLAGAAEALRAGKQPIAEIALDCGFADQSHLSRRFRDLYGVAPAAYRRMFV